MRFRTVLILRWCWTVLVCLVGVAAGVAFVGCLWSLPGCSLLRVDLPHGVLGPALESTSGTPPPLPGQGPSNAESPWLAAVLGVLVVAGDVAGILHRRKFHQKNRALKK